MPAREIPKLDPAHVLDPKKAALAITSAAETDLIGDLVHEIESLEKSDAIARLIELEDAQGTKSLRSSPLRGGASGEAGDNSRSQ